MEAYLKEHLSDTSGALRTVLLRRLASSEHLDGRYDQPLQFLADGLQHVLASEERMRDLVTDADIEWSRITGERPFFEKEGKSPHPDDPYTLLSIQTTLKMCIRDSNYPSSLAFTGRTVISGRTAPTSSGM